MHAVIDLMYGGRYNESSGTSKNAMRAVPETFMDLSLLVVQVSQIFDFFWNTYE